MLNKSPYEELSELLEQLDALAKKWDLRKPCPEWTSTAWHAFCAGQDSGYEDCVEDLKTLVAELSDNRYGRNK